MKKSLNSWYKFCSLFLLSLMMVFFVYSCSQSPAPQATERSQNKKATNEASQSALTNQDTKSEASESQEEDSEIAKLEEEVSKKYDAATLKVFNVRVSKLRQGLTTGLSLSYDPDGRSDYIDYKICPLEVTGKECEGDDCTRGGECYPGVTVYNRLRLPGLYAGKVKYSVRSCLDRNNALTDQSCGDWEEIIYDNQSYNIRIAILKDRVLKYKDELGRLTEEEYRGAFVTYKKEIEACDAHNAEVQKVLDSKARIVEQFLRAPAKWFGQAGRDFGDLIMGEGKSDEVIGKVKEFGKLVGAKMEEACVKIGQGTNEAVCKVLKGVANFGKQFLSMFNPITPLGTLSNAIHDVVIGTFKGEGEKLVAKGCHAEENLQRSVNAIETKMQTVVNNLMTIKQELQAAGEIGSSDVREWQDQ